MFLATVQCYEVVRFQLLLYTAAFSLVNSGRENWKLKTHSTIFYFSCTHNIMFMNSTTILLYMHSLQFVILFNAAHIVQGGEGPCHKIFNNWLFSKEMSLRRREQWYVFYYTLYDIAPCAVFPIEIITRRT